MGLEPVKFSCFRRQNPTSPATGSSSSTDDGTQTATSGQSSATDTSQSNVSVSSTATSEAPTSSVAPSSAPSTPTSVSTAPDSSSSIGSSSSQNSAPSSSNPPTSSGSVSVDSLSSASPSSSSSNSVSSSSARTPSSSSATPSSTSTSTSSSTSSSSTASSTTSSLTSTSTSILASTSSSDLSTMSTTSFRKPTSSDSTTASLTTITSSIVTTINGHPTTVATTFPTTLNSPPSTAPSSGRRTGIIAGSAIAAGLLILSILSGLFIFYRRRKLRKISLAHRTLPTPRSALLADEDGFDLTDSAPSGLMGESGDRRSAAPQLLRARGHETGSIFHEEVWPPPGERSRLEDPLLMGSTVDLASIVDDIMGARDQHGRSISADTTRSDMPLLANMSPERNGDMPKGQPSTSVPRSRFASSYDAYPSEMSPLNTSGHERQLSDDRSPGVPGSSPAAGPPAGAATSTGVDRVKSGRSMMSVSTTGSPPSEFTHLHGGGRAGAAGTGFGLGSLIVVNATPEAEREELERGRDQREAREREQPLVDLRTTPEDTPPREIPPLYHMIPRNASDTWTGGPPQHQQEAGGGADTASHVPQSPQLPQSPPLSTPAHFGLAM